MPKDTKENTPELPLKDLERGIYLKCSGSYYSMYKSVTEVEDFQTLLLFSKIPVDMEAKKGKLLALVQSQMINQHLKANPEKFPHFYKCRECKIEEIIYNFIPNEKIPVSETSTNVRTMSMEELKVYIFANNLKTKIDDYSTIYKAREAVFNDEENKKILDAHMAKEKKKNKGKFVAGE